MADGGPRPFSVANHMDYVNYLKLIEDRWPEYNKFRRYLERNANSYRHKLNGITGHISIHDIRSDNSFLPPLTFKAGESMDVQSLKDALSNLPTRLRARLIVIDLDSGKAIDQRVLNLLRLSFDIEPLFFWSLLDGSDYDIVRRPTFLGMGFMTLKAMRDYPAALGDMTVGAFLTRQNTTKEQVLTY